MGGACPLLDGAGTGVRKRPTVIAATDTRLPLYTLFKTAVFLYLAISSTGTPYVYNNFLAPLFAEHEPAIDEFIGSVRGQAGAHTRSGLGWVYERVRAMLGLTPQQASYINQAGQQHLAQQYAQGGFGSAAPMVHPPTLNDPASGGLLQVAGMMQGLASRYLPSALAAVSAAAGSAQQTAARGFDVPPPPVPPKFEVSDASPPVPPPPSQLAGSRAFQYAADEVYGSARASGQGETRSRTLDASRTSSDGSLSGGSNLAASFTEIRREEAVGAEVRPAPNRRTSSSWMPWGSGPSTPKADKTQ
ncbi:hypothetical protein CC85DRAFT_286721 [Cutaneotrichosporon oleaginosum]|uniref:Protein YOP1 n=1 Tax=Cutaneotrichosporon oleaginosum TaxID=879819 RepID=A0A0J0XJC6_9TREE|nr:uncharacterized protein CC85DRAFT_286721 [Cutaneotrichosporon oleaginosum]KLT41161.1 hypothetical protein CC85DRAFT_286721 [Cutaneotrichosporon oleaginosum]TXT14121.1 hypothetical protein COLE_00314 [Cutaneotrichosporon oleaginosum]